MTSGPLETKPITRGAWIAGVIFQFSPPPPPAEVPPLPEDKAYDDSLTLRERSLITANGQIVPGVMKSWIHWVLHWRILIQWVDGVKNMKMAVRLIRVERFSELINFPMLLNLKMRSSREKDRFVRALAGHLLAFGLGRELTPADSLALDEIVERVKVRGLFYEIDDSRGGRL